MAENKQIVKSNKFVAGEEFWADVVGYEGRYLVSDKGRIWSVINKKIMKQFDNKGYKVISLYDGKKYKTKKVHRIVAEAFFINPDNKPEVNHLDGDKSNNEILNLEWATNHENQIHKYRILKVQMNWAIKKPVRCKETKKIYSSQSEAAKAVGCGQGLISLAISRGGLAKGFHWEGI